MTDDLRRELIGSLELGATHSAGKPVVELFSTDTRLKYPVLRLFDLSALITVGLDPDDLEPGKRVHKRFFAFYTESDKVNKGGNNYRDVSYLEPVDPASGSQEDLPKLLTALQAQTAELRAIRALLQALVARTTSLADPFTIPEPGAPPPPTSPLPEGPTDDGDLDDFFPRQAPAAQELAPDPVEEVEEAPADGHAPRNAASLGHWLNDKLGQDACQGAGHLLYGIKKMDPGWPGWPTTTDQAGWDKAAALWLRYARDTLGLAPAEPWPAEEH